MKAHGEGKERWEAGGWQWATAPTSFLPALLWLLLGAQVANSTSSLFCAIAASAGAVRAQALIRANRWDLIHFQWLHDSLQAGELVGSA